VSAAKFVKIHILDLETGLSCLQKFITRTLTDTIEYIISHRCAAECW